MSLGERATAVPGGQLLVRHVEVGEGLRGDVRIADGVVEEMGPRLRRRRGEEVLDGGGGALLPGLADHHLHLRSLAAAAASVRCGPPEVADRDQLAGVLARAAANLAPGEWVRGISYHESVAGELDRAALDAMVPDRPVRVQHRSGRLWVLNSAALWSTPIGAGALPAGAGTDADGRPDGRLIDLDGWIRDHSPPPPTGADALGAVSRRLIELGVTACTDATWSNGLDDLEQLARAVESGELLQELTVMGREELADAPEGLPLAVGPLKVVLRDHDLEPLGELAGRIAASHRRRRAVAFHCVTGAELVLALGALEEAGPLPGDRVEHAGVVPPDAVPRLARLGVTVVTQPHFVAERGDDYLSDVDADEVPYLYRAASLAAAGVALLAGSDAPFGGSDPWAAMRAAVLRRTAEGRVVDADERLSPEQAVALFTNRSGDGRLPALGVGRPGDLCLLHLPWSAARCRLGADLVAATVRAGRVLHRADPVPG